MHGLPFVQIAFRLSMILNSIEQCSADRTITLIAANSRNLIHQLIETGFQGCRKHLYGTLGVCRMSGCKLITNDTSGLCRVIETCAKIVPAAFCPDARLLTADTSVIAVND